MHRFLTPLALTVSLGEYAGHGLGHAPGCIVLFVKGQHQVILSFGRGVNGKGECTGIIGLDLLAVVPYHALHGYVFHRGAGDHQLVSGQFRGQGRVQIDRDHILLVSGGIKYLFGNHRISVEHSNGHQVNAFLRQLHVQGKVA